MTRSRNVTTNQRDADHPDDPTSGRDDATEPESDSGNGKPAPSPEDRVTDEDDSGDLVPAARED